MFKKIIAGITLTALILLTVSCYSTKEVYLNRLDRSRNAKILAVTTRSGKVFRFSRQNPAYVVGDVIFGPVRDPKTGKMTSIEIPCKDVTVVKYRMKERETTFVVKAIGIGALLLVIKILRIIVTGADPF